MAASLQVLRPDFRVAVERMRNLAETRGCTLLIYDTLRPLDVQARYYRQSRSWSEISRKIGEYRGRGLDIFADVLERVGPQHGRWATNAGPAESWHNYGLAFDACPLVDGACVWDEDDPLWNVYAECVREVGLSWGGDWGKRRRDMPHTQAGWAQGNPLITMGPGEAMALLRDQGLLET